MPGSMIHLLVANRVNPNASALFFLGNIAPDAVVDWHDKDATHFRDLDDRQPAFISIAKEILGDFAEGILLHLYFDWKWDTIVRKKFINKIGNDWFPSYRNELSRASSYAFHHTGWAKQIWDDMDSIDINDYGITPRASIMDVKDFVSRNNKWYNKNVMESSPAFPPDLIDDFTMQVADEYKKWRKTLCGYYNR